MLIQLKTKLPIATWRVLPKPKLSLPQRLKVFYRERVYAAWRVLIGKAYSEDR